MAVIIENHKNIFIGRTFSRSKTDVNEDPSPVSVSTELMWFPCFLCCRCRIIIFITNTHLFDQCQSDNNSKQFIILAFEYHTHPRKPSSSGYLQMQITCVR